MRQSNDRGYAMAALLVALSVMAIMLGMALPAWRTWVQREREAELIFRGEQYAHAIELFSRRTGGFPTSFEALRDGRYIRKLYKDPVTNGDFQPVYLGQIATAAPVPAGRGGPAAPPGARGQPPGRAGQPGAVGATPGLQGTPTGRLGQPPATPGQGGSMGQGGPLGAGPIIGVVSRSTADALRLYNGRGRYNEWLFLSTAATVQAGAPAGVQAPGMPPGRGAGPAGRGRGTEAPGPGRRGLGRGATPGDLTPFDRPSPPGRGRGGFQPSPFGRPGGPGGAPSPFTPGQRGRL